MFGIKRKNGLARNVSLLEKQAKAKLKLLQKRNLMLGFENIRTIAAQVDYHRLLEQTLEAKWKEAATRLREARAKGKDTSTIAFEMQRLEDQRKSEEYIYERLVKKFKKAAE
jgi:hypothetical protein